MIDLADKSTVRYIVLLDAAREACEALSTWLPIAREGEKVRVVLSAGTVKALKRLRELCQK